MTHRTTKHQLTNQTVYLVRGFSQRLNQPMYCGANWSFTGWFTKDKNEIYRSSSKQEALCHFNEEYIQSEMKNMQITDVVIERVIETRLVEVRQETCQLSLDDEPEPPSRHVESLDEVGDGNFVTFAIEGQKGTFLGEVTRRKDGIRLTIPGGGYVVIDDDLVITGSHRRQAFVGRKITIECFGYSAFYSDTGAEKRTRRVAK